MESSFPQIFQTEDLAYEDRFSVYWDEILQYCKPGEVRERVAKYVAQHVSASEWRAVWRSTPASNGTQNNCDIVVEVDCLVGFSSSAMHLKTRIQALK